MSYIVTNVDSYRPWAPGGTVVHHLTGQKRVFRDTAEAKAFVELSHMRDAQIKDYR